MKRNPKILTKEKSVLLVVDIQEKILNVMQHKERVVENTVKLIKGFRLLNLPVYYTEQYPKGLGETEPEIKAELKSVNAIQKMSFSCYGAGDLFEEFKKKNLSQIVVCGIETHVCIQQTVLDLLANGFQVNLPADAVSSRKLLDYEIALRRMENNGAEVTSTEAVLFELLNVCGTQEFKDILKIVK